MGKGIYRMIKRIVALFRRPEPEPVVDMADLIIAVRARKERRSEDVSSKYRRVHTILQQGLQR